MQPGAANGPQNAKEQIPGGNGLAGSCARVVAMRRPNQGIITRTIRGGTAGFYIAWPASNPPTIRRKLWMADLSRLGIPAKNTACQTWLIEVP
jgi:hypothetical protein